MNMIATRPQREPAATAEPRPQNIAGRAYPQVTRTLPASAVVPAPLDGKHNPRPLRPEPGRWLWLARALATLRRFRRLPDSWNSYSARRINPAIISAAEGLLR